MKQEFNFTTLTSLLHTTHKEMQNRANHSVNIALVARNWLFGWYITEFEQEGNDRAKYGSNLINDLANSLNFKGSSATNLKKFRQFFREYPIRQTVSVESGSKLPTVTNWQTVSGELLDRFTLSWSHYITLLTLDNQAERSFYEIESSENNWSVRELQRQISSSFYERLALSKDKKEIKLLAKHGVIVEKASDLIKNPFVLEFLDLVEQHRYSEHELETAIINKLEAFLLELGKGFLFEARQKRFTFDNNHFYIDLVFYNRLLKCYVLIDLKRNELSHQDLGQMQMYINYFDRYVKTDEEAPTIGMLLCHQKNDALVELTLPKENNIYASKYQLYLPSKEELKAKLLEIEAEFDREILQRTLPQKSESKLGESE